MAKKYIPEKMMRDSRYRRYFEGLGDDERRDALERMRRLIDEERQWCDRGNYGHLCNILATLALDETLAALGMTPDERLRVLSEAMWSALNPKPMKRLARLSFFVPLMKKVVPLGFSKKSGRGWSYVWHLDTDPANEFHFECTECLYRHIFEKRGVLERFGPMFCHSDIINYGQLPYTDFIRTQTLCQGGDLCDFRFVRHPKGEQWTRTESV